MIFDDNFAPLPTSLRAPISIIGLENYPGLTGLSRCLLTLLATIPVLTMTTRARARRNETIFGHYFSLDQITGR